MKKENDELFNKNIQKWLNKFISEEQIAHAFYLGSIRATCKCQAGAFKNMFEIIAEDELDDHEQRLIDYAIDNDYDVAFSFKDYEKYANGKLLRQLNNLKKGEKVDYYIEEGIKSELLAIEGYEEAIADTELPYDFVSMLYQILFDEKEHLGKLQVLSDALKAGATLTEY